MCPLTWQKDFLDMIMLRILLKLQESFKLLNLFRLWEAEVKTREESEQYGTKEVYLRPKKDNKSEFSRVSRKRAAL